MSFTLEPFRPIRPQDDEAVAAFNALRREAVGAAQGVRLSADQEWRSLEPADKTIESYFAAVNDVPVAVAARIRFRKPEKVLSILSLAVAPELRRQRLGSEALSQIVTMAEKRQARLISLSALAPAESFYQQNGFESNGYDHGFAIMRKKLE